MIKVLYVPDYKEPKYGPFIQRLVKYADAANFAGEKVTAYCRRPDMKD